MSRGLFLNADAGYDFKDFRSACAAKEISANICFNKRNGNVERDEYFDREPYDERYVIERTNAWMDSFRSLLNRFDTTTESWKGFNYLSFIVLALKSSEPKSLNEFLLKFYLFNAKCPLSSFPFDSVTLNQ